MVANSDPDLEPLEPQFGTLEPKFEPKEPKFREKIMLIQNTEILFLFFFFVL